jgi:hypothetical protein
LLPELDRFPSRDAAQRALEDTKRDRPMLWVILVIALAPTYGTILWKFVLHGLIKPANDREVILQNAAFISFQILMAFIGFRLWISPIRKSLRQSLQAKGIPICIPCGYDLRGQLEPRCPECGAPFDAHLVSQLVIDDQPS